MSDALPGARPVSAPRGTTLTARGWPQEAALRMLQNNLDSEVAEHPDKLVVYGGTGRAARDWASFDAMIRTLTTLANVSLGLGVAGAVAATVIFLVGRPAQAPRPAPTVTVGLSGNGVSLGGVF